MIHERAMLCDLTMTSFTGVKTSRKDTEDLLESKAAHKGAASVVVRLIPPKALAPVNSVTTKIRSVHKYLTAPWNESADILPTSLFLDHSTMMADGFKERDEAVDEFCRIYPSLESKARLSLGELDFGRLWVPVEQVRASFTHRVRHWPVPQGSDFRCDLDEEDLARVRAQADQDARAMWAGAMSNIKNRLVVVMQDLVEKLESYKIEYDEAGNTRVAGTFRDSIFNAAYGLMDTMRHFNNIDPDTKIDHAIEAIRGSITMYSPETLRNSQTARDRTINEAQTLIKMFS